MIMEARVKAGWIDEADLAPPAAEEAAGRSAEAGRGLSKRRSGMLGGRRTR